MSKLADALREHGIYNNHNLLTKFGDHCDVAVTFNSAAHRADTNHTTVWSAIIIPGTTKRYNKEFYGQKKYSFPEALKWAEDKFKHRYVASPFGGHIPVHIKERAIQKVKETARDK